MATGPQRARLDQHLSGAHDGAVSNSGVEWQRCAQILRQVGSALENASPQMKQEIGGETGPAVDAAFHRSAQGMSAKADELVKGAGALLDAAHAIDHARREQAKLAAQPLTEPTPYQPGPGPRTDQDIQREAASRQAQHDYQAQYADQETRAKAAADHMDQVYGRSTATMKEIHGETGGKKDTGGGGGGTTTAGGTTGGGGSAHAPAQQSGPTYVGSGPRDFHQPVHQPTHSTDPTIQHPTQPDGTDGVPQPVPTGDGASQGGVPIDYPGGSGSGSGSGSTLPGASVPAASAGSTGVSGTTGLGLAGAAAGGVGGGLLGTGLATGGLRGGLTPMVSNPGTATSGVRGIGATARSGVSPTLGRASGTSGTSGVSTKAGASTGATASRGAGAGARSGAGAAGRSGSRGAGAGSRGAAGGRGTGAGAGGRSGRGKDEKKGRKHDLFDVAEDWVDDEDAAPGVID